MNTDTLAPSRLLPLRQCFNCRDLGGLPTRTGGHIKRQLLLRSDDLGTLNADDLQVLQHIPVHTVVDFRTVGERQASPNCVPASCQQQLHLDLMGGSMDKYMAWVQQAGVNSREVMATIYHDLVLNPDSQQQYRRFFAWLQQAPTGATLFHCSAGKDRTGLASALILAALQVDEALIMQDYLLSNELLQGKYAHIIAAHPHMHDFLTVSADYLQAAWQLMAQHHGSVSRYLTQVLHVDCQRLQELYLE